MLRKISFALIVMIFTVSLAQADTWNIDNVHSSVGFSVRHLVVSKTKGQFKDFNGTVEFDGTDLSKGSVEFTVQTTSVDTENEDRDNHLRSDDFFNAEKYPAMTFKSKSVTVGDDGEFKLNGDLTIRDKTEEVTFDCEFHGTVNDPWGNTKAGFTATTTIDRQGFGLSFNKTLETGGLVVGDDVEITMELELTKAK